MRSLVVMLADRGMVLARLYHLGPISPPSMTETACPPQYAWIPNHQRDLQDEVKQRLLKHADLERSEKQQDGEDNLREHS